MTGRSFCLSELEQREPMHGHYSRFLFYDDHHFSWQKKARDYSATPPSTFSAAPVTNLAPSLNKLIGFFGLLCRHSISSCHIASLLYYIHNAIWFSQASQGKIPAALRRRWTASSLNHSGAPNIYIPDSNHHETALQNLRKTHGTQGF